jgi:hypothetical protein
MAPRSRRIATWLFTLGTFALMGGALLQGCAAGDDEGDSSRPPESCTDGADDNGDGAADCADASCQGTHACTSAIPAGWEELGHTVLALYESADPEPDCPSTFPDVVRRGPVDPVVPGSACGPCECGTFSAECALPDLDPAQAGVQGIKVSSRKCEDPGLPTLSWVSVPPEWDGTCYSPDAYPGGQTSCVPGDCNVSASTGPLAITGGCDATGGEPTPYTWTLNAKLCGGGPEGVGCEGGACRPLPPEGFEVGFCVAKAGDAACPDGFPAKTSIYDAAELAPAVCSACTCDGTPDSACAGTVTIYSDTSGVSCMTEVVSFDAGNCVDLPGNPAIAGRELVITAEPTGTCTASGGGDVTTPPAPGAPITVCCAP